VKDLVFYCCLRILLYLKGSVGPEHIGPRRSPLADPLVYTNESFSAGDSVESTIDGFVRALLMRKILSDIFLV
jgi:hypothetical protein